MPTLSRRIFTAGMLTLSPLLGRQVATPIAQPTLRLVGPASGLASFDPALARDLDTIFVMRQVHRGLLSLDRDVRPVPELADVTTIDNWTFRFTLRPSARFSDGTRITPEAVHRSLVRAISPSTAIYLGDIDGATDVLNGIETDLIGWTGIAADSFDLRLIRPSRTFLSRIAAVQAAIVDVDNPTNTSGPFIVRQQTRDSLELLPNAAYARPPAVRLSFRLGASAINAPNLLQSGEIDLATIDGDTAALLADPASGLDFDVIRIPQLATFFVALSNTMPPWDDVRLRIALQESFDPGTATRRLYGDTVDPATGLVPPTLLTPPAIAAVEGEPIGRLPGDLPIYATDTAPIEQVAASANAAGLDLQPIQVGWNDFLDGLAAKRFPAYGIFWGADYPSPEAFLRMLFYSQSADNYIAFVDAEYDRLVDAASFAAAQQRLIDLAVVIPVYHDVQYTAHRRDIVALPISAMGLLGLESVVLPR